jgi:hypothetical protein
MRVIRGLAAAHAATEAAEEAAKLRRVGELLDVLGHHSDEAVRLGLPEASVLSEEAILGAGRFLEETKDVAKAKEMATTFANGQKNLGWHAGTMDEYFRFAKCIPAKTPGFDRFLSKVKGVNAAKGAYAVMRLYCEAPELAGKDIETIADLLENGKEGVDVVTRLPSNVPGFVEKIPEFWEVKHVSDAFGAVNEKQIRKHIQTKVGDTYDKLLQRGLTPQQAQQVMSQVKLRFEVIAPNATAAAKEKLFQDVSAVLNEFQQLKNAGFRFDRSDIFIRPGNPLVTPTPKLAAAL